MRNRRKDARKQEQSRSRKSFASAAVATSSWIVAAEEFYQLSCVLIVVWPFYVFFDNENCWRHLSVLYRTIFTLALISDCVTWAFRWMNKMSYLALLRFSSTTNFMATIRQALKNCCIKYLGIWRMHRWFTSPPWQRKEQGNMRWCYFDGGSVMIGFGFDRDGGQMNSTKRTPYDVWKQRNPQQTKAAPVVRFRYDVIMSIFLTCDIRILRWQRHNGVN